MRRLTLPLLATALLAITLARSAMPPSPDPLTLLAEPDVPLPAAIEAVDERHGKRPELDTAAPKQFKTASFALG